MKSDINLISLNQSELVNEGRMVRLFRIFAIASVSVVGVSSLALFLIVSGISPSGIREQQARIEKDISSMRAKEAKIIIINRKIKDIGSIIKKRPKYDALVTDITNVIPVGVTASSLEINENKVKLIVTSGSLLLLNNFLDNLYDMVKNGKVIGSLTIDGISASGKSGTYSMSVSGDRI